MFRLAKPFFLVVETPLHVGSGSELGMVDLPIQRERHTDFPKIEGSSLKGSIREIFEELDEVKMNGTTIQGTGLDEAISLAFGPEEGEAHAGALGFTDARLLLFPVKSMKGIFAWITCPKVLERFKMDLELCKKSGAINLDFKKLYVPNNDLLESEKKTESASIGKCITSSSKLLINNKNVILEEYSFEKTNGKEENFDKNVIDLAEFMSTIVGDPIIKEKLVILHDDDFRDFVNLSTEVITRIKINNETGTVQSGALFTEEYLPVESILYSLALTTPIFKENKAEKGIFQAADPKAEAAKVIEFFTEGLPEIIQIGGNATIGKGLVLAKVKEVKDGKK